MRRRTTLALVAGGTTVGIAGAAILRDRLGGRGSEAVPPDDDAMFTLFAPGAKFAFWCNGPVGWVMARVMPWMEAGLRRSGRSAMSFGSPSGRFIARMTAHDGRDRWGS